MNELLDLYKKAEAVKLMYASLQYCNGAFEDLVDVKVRERILSKELNDLERSILQKEISGQRITIGEMDIEEN